MRALIALGVLIGLAACGAEGPPEPVETESSVRISGSASIGVTGRF